MTAADEVYRLQTGSDPESLLFQSVATQGHYGGSRGGTRQGIYVVSPAGELLGALNSNDAQRVQGMLLTALERWEPQAADRAELPEVPALDTTDRWERSLPADGLVLRLDKRDGPDATGGRSARWNRDFAWFSKEEVTSLVPQGDPGESMQWPMGLAQRLARFHWVDNVRGQTLPFAPEEVEQVSMTSEILEVEGDLVRLRLEGHSLCRSASWLLGENYWKPRKTWPHGIHASATGSAVFDRQSGRFVEFEMLVLAVRWGRTVNNGRAHNTEPSLIAMTMILESPSQPTPVAPTFINLYGVDWVPGSSQPR